ncbi:unnamed protein product [Calypogeia fissa]
MDSSHGDEEEAALSDFEDDDLEAAPVVLPVQAAATPQPLFSTQPDGLKVVESLNAALADLEQERQARKAAEAAKADADATVVKLKSYVHEAIKQRDEAWKGRDEALKAKEECSKQLEEALQLKDERSKQLEEAVQLKEERSKQLEEALKLKEDASRQKDEISAQRDEIQRQKDDMNRARDSAKAEIESVARILVTQAEKIMSMSNGVKSFSGGLPRVKNSTGLTAIALGFAKRVEEVVEEVLRQREAALKRSNELHMQMEQRNLNIAIEVSQLEASITQMKEDVAKKSSELERWQKLAAGKDGRIADIEREMLEQLGKTKQEAEALRQRVEEVESKLEVVNSETAQNVECAAKVKSQLLDILGLMQTDNSFSSFQTDLVESPEGETEPQQKGFLAEGQEIMDLTSRVAQLWKENQQKAEKERKDFESTVKMLHAEKGDILQKLSFPDHQKASPEGSEVGSTEDTEDNRTGSMEDGELPDGKNSSTQEVTGQDNTGKYQIIGEGPQQTSLKLLQSELAAHVRMKEETASKVALLEQDAENLQKEVKRTVSSARLEIERLQQQVTAQGRDVAGKTARIVELEKHVESVTGELLAAEEEVSRWKEAATAEAAAGARMLEEVEIRNKEIAALNERSAKYRELVEEANTKVGSKEDMALAAIAALNAAERSRQIADERAADLRDRMEELNRQIEELEQTSEHRGCGLLDWCLPWLRGRGRRGHDTQLSAEMEELLDPLV